MDSVAKPSIQIVDDDPFILKLLKRLLEQQGISEVTTSISANAVLEQIRVDTFTPDLILLDLNMPQMDGLAFIRTLAATEYVGTLALLSGEDAGVLGAAVKLAKAHGIEVLGHLCKPVNAVQLNELLEEWRSVNALQMPEERPAASKSYSADELRAALCNGELINYYQPKVEVSSGRVTGLEALVRWCHPDDGMVAPDQFIPLAEKHGLIDELTRKVMAHALADIQRWRAAGLSFPVAINISMENLTSFGFLEDICAQIAEAQVLPQELSFEVTESRLPDDMRNALEALTRLRLKHFDLSLDDFGTGYATFSQLSDFPFTELKIDRRFVHGAADNGTVRNFYHASLSLAREFGLKVVAEGVEDRADWDFIRASGELFAQGFFIARPMPAEQVYTWSLEWQKRVARERMIPQARGEYVI